MDIKQIQELLKAVNKSSITELKVKDKDFEITIKQSGPNAEPQVIAIPSYNPLPQATPVVAPITTPAAPQAEITTNTTQPSVTPTEANGNFVTVKSPMIGTFYRSPSPDKPAFANVGDDVKQGQVLCIIEAMKLFNEIESEVSGKIIKVLVDDATPVEYDQPLFLIEP